MFSRVASEIGFSSAAGVCGLFADFAALLSGFLESMLNKVGSSGIVLDYKMPACLVNSVLSRKNGGIRPQFLPHVPDHRKRNRDRRVAALSLDLVPAENQRAIRALNQALLAGELHDAMALCLQSNLLMPLAVLLRSLIDTSVLGVWLLKYATDEEVRESVKGTDHEFYRDVLHPSIHGDALHIAMRIRHQSGLGFTNAYFTQITYTPTCSSSFAKNGNVSQEFRDYLREESTKSIRVMTGLDIGSRATSSKVSALVRNSKS
jgi:hypothetical protein